MKYSQNLFQAGCRVKVIYGENIMRLRKHYKTDYVFWELRHIEYCRVTCVCSQETKKNYMSTANETSDLNKIFKPSWNQMYHLLYIR